jgi:hypothetical protein
MRSQARQPEDVVPVLMNGLPAVESRARERDVVKSMKLIGCDATIDLDENGHGMSSNGLGRIWARRPT